MFIGSEVRLEGIVDNQLLHQSFIGLDVGQIDVVGATEFTFDNVVQFAPEITGISRDSGDSDGIFKRVIIDDDFLVSLQNTSIVDIAKQYETLRKGRTRTSLHLMRTLLVLRLINLDFSNAFTSETFDQDKFEFFSSDSDVYYSKLDVGTFKLVTCINRTWK